jgi:hypothetical protein
MCSLDGVATISKRRRRNAGWPMTDRVGVVGAASQMRPVPKIDLLGSSPPRHDRPAVEDLPHEGPSGPLGLHPRSVRGESPLVELAETVPAGIARTVIGPGDIAIDGHRHIEYRR